MTIITPQVRPVLTVGILFALATPLFSQEFFREFGTSRTSGGIGRLTPSAEVFQGNSANDHALTDSVDLQTEEEKYNLRLGLIDFVLAAGLGVEFNDNIGLANSSKISDIILRPAIDIEGIMRISELNTLRFGLGIGYAKYLDNSEFDSESVTLSPTSSLVWTAKSGNLTFTVRERIAYQEDPFDQPVLSNVVTYRRWENQAGIEVDWEATEYARVAVGFDRFDLWAKEEAFTSQDREINTVFVRPSYDINPSWTAGINGSLSWLDYVEDIQADGTSLLVGPFVQVKVSDSTDVYFEIGWQKSNFDGGTKQLVGTDATGFAFGPIDTEDSERIYYKLQISNRPNEVFRHTLTASRTTESGLGSNFYDLFHIEYSADWLYQERTSLTPTAFYEYYETSGSSPEEASRLGLALGIHHIYSNALTLGLDYRFLMKDSNLTDSDYKQNLVMMSLYYKF